MKVTCQRDALLTACQLVTAAVAARTTKPILSNIKAIAQDDALTLMATDLEVGIRYELRGARVGRAGAAILPPVRLASILKETTDAEITIDAGEETTLIRLSTGRFELPNGSPDEFPDIPSFDNSGNYHEITAGVLRTMIKRTAFAADKKESTRFAVTGVLWEAEEGKARLVATDTKRLALCEGKADVHGAVDPKGQSHLVPLKTVQLLERNLTDDGEIVRIVLKPNEAMFQTERALIHTRLVEGRFPPYRNIIPKKLDVKLPVAVADLLARVRQAAIMVDEETKRVDFHFEPGKVTLTARGQDVGSSEVTMALPDYQGAEVDIAFDPSYLVEMLRAIEGEPTAVLEMTDGTRPALFRVGESYLYLVMPLAG
ncbi:DNA polymerase III subunit beta [Fimbriiglobus ruber]|uniref:Beta sliding clamp n=1 Tax=Fimbriiglobus ruber TaxID=1908690 RepID=A0A225E5L2_9BACT|nr:DNA polymerase III subunit beta [Fimbriiglobus ruber]OWK45396.1 DNA polymerase III beta subunit [Fimbriiglobus ruber]